MLVILLTGFSVTSGLCDFCGRTINNATIRWPYKCFKHFEYLKRVGAFNSQTITHRRYTLLFFLDFFACEVCSIANLAFGLHNIISG